MSDGPGPHSGLPTEVGRLLGRAAEVATVGAGFEVSRLVTLVGAGGSGKTRLAVHVAPDVAADTAWWIDLQPVTDPDRVPVVVGGVAGLAAVGPDPAATLATSIGERSMLFVLDNCEQVVDAVADLVEVVLRACPNVLVLATSRLPLEVAGEHVVHVNPLPVPTDPAPGPDELRAAAATALFLERATGLDVHALDPEQLTAVAEVCRRLDGLPLAIELAAARTPLLSPTQLLSGLDDRFGLLTSGGRRRPDRQRTLEASIDWSFALLDEPSRELLRRLAVAPASFDLALAVRMAGAGVDERTALDRLGALVELSLVVVGDAPSGRRYRLQESVRAFALARLTDADELERARAAHLAATVARVRELAGGPAAQEGVVLRAEPWLFDELDDVRAASAHAAATDDWAAVVDLWWPLHLLLAVHDRNAEAHAALAAVPDGAALDRVRARRLQVVLAAGPNRTAAHECLPLARELVAELRASGELDAHPLLGLCALGALAVHRAWAGHGDPAVARELVALEAAHRARWGPLPTAAVGSWATRCLDFVGHPAEAYEVAVAAIAAAAELGSRPLEAFGHVRAGAAALRLGLSVEVLDDHVARALALVPPGWEQLSVWHATTTAAGVHLTRADGAGLDALLDEVERYAGAVGGPLHTATRYGRLLAALAGGQPERALALADEVLGRLGPGSPDWFAAGTRADRAEALRVLGRTDEARAAVDLAVELQEDGTDLLTVMLVVSTDAWLRVPDDPTGALHTSTDEALRFLAADHRCWLFLQLLPAAAALCELDRHEDAARVLGTIDGEHEARGQRVWGVQQPDVDRLTAACRDALDDAGFDEAFAAGRAATWDDCVAWLARGRGARPDRAVTGWRALTPTEADVAERAALGLTTAELAEALFVSPNTVKTHLKRAYAKLGVHNRVELAAAVGAAADG